MEKKEVHNIGTRTPSRALQLIDEFLAKQEVKSGDDTEPSPAVDREDDIRPKSELDQRFALVRSIGEECIQESELRSLLQEHLPLAPGGAGAAADTRPICYDGFEPSGRMHLAQGLVKALHVNKLTRAGFKCVFWIADCFALLNDKMGGRLDDIRTVGRYMIEVWKACGMDMTNVEFLWAQEEMNKRPDEYWSLVMDIARHNSLNRLRRCAPIMGRDDEDDAMTAAQVLYPCMQCADIFFLRADVCQLGMDQRKVNALAREYAELPAARARIDAKYQERKPIVLSHHMIMSLDGQDKMSKSKPTSAIYMDDTAADVKRKIKSAFCPPGEINGNPVLDYMQHIVFGAHETVRLMVDSRFELPAMSVRREYTSYKALEQDYKENKIHPADLKLTVAAYINKMLEPVHDHFRQGEPKALRDMVHRLLSSQQKQQAKNKKKPQSKQQEEQEDEDEDEGSVKASHK